MHHEANQLFYQGALGLWSDNEVVVVYVESEATRRKSLRRQPGRRRGGARHAAGNRRLVAGIAARRAGEAGRAVARRLCGMKEGGTGVVLACPSSKRHAQRREGERRVIFWRVAHRAAASARNSSQQRRSLPAVSGTA